MARKRILTIAVAAGLLALVACGSPGPDRTPIEPTEAGATGTEGSGIARDVQIYSAVIHQVIQVDNTFGGADEEIPFDHVLIDTLIGGDHAAAGTEEADDGGEMMTAEMRDALEAELADLPAVRFVDGDAVINKEEGGLRMEEAALVSLGAISDGGERVEAKVGMLCGSLCGTWLTYVVENAAGGWKVTGTTGPVGIS